MLARGDFIVQQRSDTWAIVSPRSSIAPILATLALACGGQSGTTGDGSTGITTFAETGGDGDGDSSSNSNSGDGDGDAGDGGC